MRLVNQPLTSQYYAVLALVSKCYPPRLGSFLGITHPSATRQPKKQAFLLLPFDLHVLSLPPAFNLNHDQTLHLKVKFVTQYEFWFCLFI